MKADDGIGLRSRRGKGPQRGQKRQGVFDLQEQRLRALARTKGSIDEMQELLKTMPSDAPGRYLIEGILSSLKNAETRLEGGIVPRPAKV